ncbi:YlzJ-like family protein [Salirhabdus salicampi]|uniref:YlzJ-like family protein n=1 Tax=Salirhabdus salicampi TaxID=476102 RepID=UPI0020C50B84|nr:YlzJ-like family protein [Salirhabdus salicampi]MCP8616466.1 YlzJ-like family protein [Salirhabdus salicampi]
MILYTPLSEEDIFPTEETEYEKHQWVSVDNRYVKVMQVEDGSFEILQVLSTNPNDYMNGNLTPGSRISLY